MQSSPGRLHDGKTALLLSGSFGLAACATVPTLLPGLPPEARRLPLPLPAFCLLLGLQLTAFYGLLAFVGLRLARRAGVQPSPQMDFLFGHAARPAPLWWAIATGTGLACGLLIVLAVEAIKRAAPHSLPTTLHPPSLLAGLTASTAGSLGEEILCRLFVLSLILWLLPASSARVPAAIAASALAFGALHAPAFAMLAGGLFQAPALGWLWVLGLNGALGIVFGLAYLRGGIGCAIVSHFATDLVWHVGTQLAAS